jgi:hypothetical protein
MTMPGWGRRLRIVADWSVALVTRPDTGRIDLDEAVARYGREHHTDGPQQPVAPTPASNRLLTHPP